MIDRKKTKRAIVFLCVTALLVLIAAGMKHIWLMVLCLPLMGYDYWLVYRVNKCPYCGGELKGLKWKGESLECRDCGAEVFYDDVAYEAAEEFEEAKNR